MLTSVAGTSWKAHASAEVAGGRLLHHVIFTYIDSILAFNLLYNLKHYTIKMFVVICTEKAHKVLVPACFVQCPWMLIIAPGCPSLSRSPREVQDLGS